MFDNRYVALPYEVSIMPNTWYHQCTKLNTETGHFVIVMNGVVLADEVLDEFFVGSSSIRPKTLEGIRKGHKMRVHLQFFSGKLQVLASKVYLGLWYMSQMYITNVNVLK